MPPALGHPGQLSGVAGRPTPLAAGRVHSQKKKVLFLLGFDKDARNWFAILPLVSKGHCRATGQSISPSKEQYSKGRDGSSVFVQFPPIWSDRKLRDAAVEPRFFDSSLT